MYGHAYGPYGDFGEADYFDDDGAALSLFQFSSVTAQTMRRQFCSHSVVILPYP